MDAVIFDMDGVLVDSEPIYDRETEFFLRELGVEADRQFFDTLRGLTLRAVWQGIVDRYGLTQPVDELAVESARRLDNYFATAPDIPTIDGVPELVADLTNDGVALAVASSSRRVRVDMLLERLGVGHAFTVSVSGDEVVNGKPDPEIFLRTAELLAADPRSCVVVEDSPHGVDAALGAGMRCVGLDRGHSGLLELAHLVVDDLRYLTPDCLRAL